MKGILSTHESDFMSEFFSSYPFPSFEQNIDPSFFEGIDNEQSLIYKSDMFNDSLYSWSNEDSGDSSDSSTFFMNLCLLLDEPNASSSALYILHNEAEECADPANQILQCKRKLQTSESCNSLFDINSSNLSDNPKKKSRVSTKVCAINGQTTKNQDTFDRKEEKSVAGLNGLSSCNYSSENDSNSLQELNGGGEAVSSSKRSTAALNLNSKTRASRGSATDPQSLYARKRRERINERLRILQNMVPNGTKVDISTMLEEAVQYVKFLQLQIKLLSSDDLWMYAPIAYNAMNIGLDLNNSKPA